MVVVVAGFRRGRPFPGGAAAAAPPRRRPRPVGGVGCFATWIWDFFFFTMVNVRVSVCPGTSLFGARPKPGKR